VEYEFLARAMREEWIEDTYSPENRRVFYDWGELTSDERAVWIGRARRVFELEQKYMGLR
jgi:hypothetical protein